MDPETITYENYTFKFNVTKDQIKVNMTDNILMEIYEGIVKEDDIYVKPIKKFYSMIIRALNNFTPTLSKKSKIFLIMNNILPFLLIIKIQNFYVWLI